MTSATTDSLNALVGERFIRPQAKIDADAGDLATLLNDALNTPTNYPPLKDSVFPGDTVAIALQHDLPRPKEVLIALLDHLLTLNIEPKHITVVLPAVLADAFELKADTYRTAGPKHEEQPPAPPVVPLQRELHSINCQVHDPENSAGLAYLCANEAGDPIYVNRLLVDADVVIPVGCPVCDPSSHIQNSIYPTFGSSAAIARFGEDSSLGDRHAETELANDSLGAFFATQLIVGPRDCVTNIVAGVRKEITASAKKMSTKLWEVECSSQFDSALVTIESRAHDQSWQSFVAAVDVASKTVVDGAPIVVWSEISKSPDREIHKACQARFEETISAKLSKPMQHLAAVLKDHPVYLKSNVARSKVEEIGLSVIENLDEVQRLTSDCDRVVILHDAHCCQLSIN